VQYSGEFNPIGNGYLALYGWTVNPLVEYYILENFGTYNPAEHAQKKGQVQSDGGTYDIYLYIPTNQPTLDNVNPIQRYWSIVSSPGTRHHPALSIISTHHFPGRARKHEQD
jgi:endo-1,4-beta-xylanase